MRTLAIDLGTRRVGLAMSDEGGRFANPLEVLEVNGAEQALARVADLIRKEAVRRVVVGLPLNMDGTLGAAANAAIAWGSALLGSAGMIEVVYVDERLSSFDAEQRLIERKRGGEKMTRRRKKEQLDALVAASLLQSFLDGRLPPIDPT